MKRGDFFRESFLLSQEQLLKQQQALSFMYETYWYGSEQNVLKGISTFLSSNGLVLD